MRCYRHGRPGGKIGEVPHVPVPPPPRDDARSRARADLLWYLRHADALARWPVIGERWAQAVELRRLHGEGEGRGGPEAPPPA